MLGSRSVKSTYVCVSSYCFTKVYTRALIRMVSAIRSSLWPASPTHIPTPFMRIGAFCMLDGPRQSQCNPSAFCKCCAPLSPCIMCTCYGKPFVLLTTDRPECSTSLRPQKLSRVPIQSNSIKPPNTPVPEILAHGNCQPTTLPVACMHPDALRALAPVMRDCACSLYVC